MLTETRDVQVNDALPIPDGVLNEEKSYETTGNITVRQSSSPPSDACLKVKVIINKLWVNQAGAGNVSKAIEKANDAMVAAQKIYHDKFDSANRLQSRITFSWDSGTVIEIKIDYFKEIKCIIYFEKRLLKYSCLYFKSFTIVEMMQITTQRIMLLDALLMLRTRYDAHTIRCQPS